jgi:hypothetical protein
VKIYLLYKRKFLEVWLVPNLELYVEVYFRDQRAYLFHANVRIFSVMNFIVNNQEIFQTNSSVLSINTRNKHHLHRQNTNILGFIKVLSVLALKF